MRYLRASGNAWQRIGREKKLKEKRIIAKVSLILFIQLEKICRDKRSTVLIICMRGYSSMILDK